MTAGFRVMVMRPMRRWSELLIVLAILIAAQPLVHTHAAGSPGDGHKPAISSYSATPCAVCATANARISVSAPALHAVFSVVEELTPAPTRFTASRPGATLPSRAPPAL